MAIIRNGDPSPRRRRHRAAEGGNETFNLGGMGMDEKFGAPRARPSVAKTPLRDIRCNVLRHVSRQRIITLACNLTATSTT